MTEVINSAVDRHYFPPGPRLPPPAAAHHSPLDGMNHVNGPYYCRYYVAHIILIHISEIKMPPKNLKFGRKFCPTAAVNQRLRCTERTKTVQRRVEYAEEAICIGPCSKSQQSTHPRTHAPVSASSGRMWVRRMTTTV